MAKRSLVILFFTLFLSLSAFSFPVVVRDESGARFTALAAPMRIISTMPSNTEILYELGLGNKIIAVSSKCDFPPAVDSLPKVGDITLNAEKIISLNPDLVVMLFDTQKYQIERLRGLCLPVFVINPRNFDQLSNSILLLGKVTGTSAAARSLAARIKRGVAKASSNKKRGTDNKLLVVLWPSPLITAGKGTFIDDIIRRAGAQNLGAKASGAYPTLDFEFVMKEDPDFIVFAGKSYKNMRDALSEKKWQALKAVQDKKVMLIDSDILTRPSPRALTALELISNFVNE
ncbi:MAG: helical backbone metal receptor [Candidatus Margulisiibacteriota bacterium]